MTAHLPISAGRTNLPQLRRRIISTYRRAQEIIARAGSAPPSRTHSLMLDYGKVCDHMRADIAQASNSFATTDALVAWLLDGLEDEIMPERDRVGLGLAARAVTEAMEKARKAL